MNFVIFVQDLMIFCPLFILKSVKNYRRFLEWNFVLRVCDLNGGSKWIEQKVNPHISVSLPR